MPRKKPPKRPTMAIQRLNRTFDRLELAAALEQAGGPESDEAALAKLLRSTGPSAQCNISTLAAQLGLPYKRVVDVYKESKRLEGIVAVAQRLPQVMQDVAEDAENKWVTCTACEGTGVIVITKDAQGLPTETKKCLPCEGKGQVVKNGDPVARKQVLEMMELAGPRALTVNAPGGNVGVFSGEASLEELLKRARKGESNGADRDASGSEANERALGAAGQGRGAVIDG